MNAIKKFIALFSLLFVVLACDKEPDTTDPLVALEQVLKNTYANAIGQRVTKMEIVLNASSGIYTIENITTKERLYLPLEIMMHPNYANMRLAGNKPKWMVVCSNGTETLCEDEQCVAELIAACLNKLECTNVCPVGELVLYKS